MAFENRDYYRDDGRPDIRFAMPKLSPLFAGIAGACLLSFILQRTFDGWFATLALTFNGNLAFRQPWRLVTYSYLHGDALQYFFNMLSLYFFLPWVEAKWGWARTLGFYTLGAIAGGVTLGLMSLIFPGFRGAILLNSSSSVLAILGVCALYFGDRPVMFFLFPMTMRGLAVLAAAFFLLSTFADRNYAAASHLGGLIFGYFAPYLAGPKVADLQAAFAARRVARERHVEVASEAEIDRILAKVSAEGMHSLSRGEQRTLKQASQRQQRSTTARPAARR